MAMSDNGNSKRSRRFHNEDKAKSFAKKLKVPVIDLRDNPTRKSDFIVKYTKKDVKAVSIVNWDSE